MAIAPHPDEQRNDPKASAEGLTAAIKLNESHLLEMRTFQKKASEDATLKLRRQWKYWWDLWENNVDFSDKEDWQAKIWVPKVFSAVEQGTSLIQRALLDTPDSFGMEGVDDRDVQLAGIWRPLIRLLMDRAKFPYKFADAAKIGFITGVAGYLKFRWVTTLVPTLSALSFNQMGQPDAQFSNAEYSFMAIDTVMPWNIRRDPESKPRENFSGSYLYHSEWKGRPALKAMAAAGWDKAKIDALLATKTPATGDSMTTIQMEEREKFYETGKAHKFRVPYLVDEFWGDVLDENGDVVYPNALMVACHDKIVFGPYPNPLWQTDLSTGRRKWPFLASTPLVHPFRFEGRGIVEQDAALATLFSNVFMLWADSLNWSVNKPTEVNQDALVDWEDLEHIPGKLWVKHGPEKALIPADVGGVDTNEVLASLNYIDQNRQNSNFITDFAVGLPGARSDVTKGETQIKTAQSMAIFETMGKNLELLGREAAEMTYGMGLQFIDQTSNPNFERLLGPRGAILSQMQIQERIDALQGQFDFKFTGVSQALMKSDQLQKIMQFSTLASSPMFAGSVRPDQLLTIIADLLGVTDRIDIMPVPPPMPLGMQQAAAGAPPTEGNGIPKPPGGA
jgi:hypothetical protein